SHARDFRQAENAFHYFFARRDFDFIDSHGVRNIKAPGPGSSQRFEMRPTAEHFADLVHISADVEAFAAKHTEIDFRQGDSSHRIAVNVDEARLAFDHFSLAREFVERNTAVFFRGNHWRYLIKIAPEFFERSADFIFTQRRDGSLVDHCTLSILRVGGDAKH